MSTLDQPLLIANSNYHVGHQIAIFVAKEQGFFQEEGLKEYEYDSRGLIPGPIERDGLAMAIKNHGVDIATAVDVEAAIYQRSLGADLYIVGGWRYTPFLKWYGAKHVTDMSKLRGGRIGMREKEGLVQVFITDALRAAGVDPDTEVHWVYDPVFGYRNNPAHMEMLRLRKNRCHHLATALFRSTGERRLPYDSRSQQGVYTTARKVNGRHRKSHRETRRRTKGLFSGDYSEFLVYA